MRVIAKRLAGATLLLALGVLLPYVVAEGIYSLARGTSLGGELYRRWFVDQTPQDPSPPIITDAAEITALLDDMRRNGVGLGNSPYDELDTEAAAINRTENGCLVQKPNLRKTMSYLRSNLFNPFDQLTYFYDRDRVLPSAIERLFQRYGVRAVHLTTNEHGERRTVPELAAPDKVLVVGDSVANGVMLDDSETLASQLQARDAQRQYINLGIARATTADIVCALEAAAARYPGQIREVIYVFCENDFSASDPLGQPADLIGRLAAFQKRAQIQRMVLLYVPYIYNALPEVTRIAGHSHRNFPTHREEKQHLLTHARQAGFAVVDYLAVVNAQRQAAASPFAPLALYVDHTHLSPLGISLLLPPLEAVR